jgi:hypothetical protein
VREERSGATLASALERVKGYFLFSSGARRVGRVRVPG